LLKQKIEEFLKGSQRGFCFLADEKWRICQKKDLLLNMFINFNLKIKKEGNSTVQYMILLVFRTKLVILHV
jgi:hypothetical protein